MPESPARNNKAVIGAGGALTGYGGGMKNKIALLKLEACNGQA